MTRKILTDKQFYMYLLIGLTSLMILNANNIYSKSAFNHPEIKIIKNVPAIEQLLLFSQKLNNSLINIKHKLFLSPKPKQIEILPIAKTKVLKNTNKENQPSKFKQPQKEKAKNTRLHAPLRFLLIGDSLVLHSFGAQTEKQLDSYTGFVCLREAHFSTGLNRIDYFNWYRRTQELIDSYHPDIIIIMVGANDGQNIVTNEGKIARLYIVEWEKAYQARVHRYLETFSPQVKKIYWIGQPVPRSKDFYYKFKIINNDKAFILRLGTKDLNLAYSIVSNRVKEVYYGFKTENPNRNCYKCKASQNCAIFKRRFNTDNDEL
jgi:hypothetical protein